MIRLLTGFIFLAVLVEAAQAEIVQVSVPNRTATIELENVVTGAAIEHDAGAPGTYTFSSSSGPILVSLTVNVPSLSQAPVLDLTFLVGLCDADRCNREIVVQSLFEGNDYVRVQNYCRPYYAADSTDIQSIMDRLTYCRSAYYSIMRDSPGFSDRLDDALIGWFNASYALGAFRNSIRYSYVDASRATHLNISISPLYFFDQSSVAGVVARGNRQKVLEFKDALDSFLWPLNLADKLQNASPERSDLIRELVAVIVNAWVDDGLFAVEELDRQP